MLNADKIKLVELRRELHKNEMLFRRVFRAFGFDHGDEMTMWKKEQRQVLTEVGKSIDRAEARR